MITNFETYTIELTDDELKIVSIIVNRFTKQKGSKYIVTNSQIVSGLERNFKIKISESRIRKIIQYIRINNLLPGLIATSKGYYTTENIDELEQWIESMKQRENAMRESRTSIENYLNQLKNGYSKFNQRNQSQIEFDF